MPIVSDYKHNQIVSQQEHKRHGGDQDIIRYRNGYGASVIKNQMSMGQIEIAVIRFNGQEDDQFELCYDTSVTCDVVRCHDEAYARTILDRIGALPPDAQALAGARLSN